VDLEFNVVSWPVPGTRASLLGAEADLVRADGESAAVWHRVPGVDGQVDQHLLQPSRLRHHRGQGRRRLEDYLSAAAHADVQQIDDAGDQGVKVDRLWLGSRAFAEAKQVVREVNGAVRGTADLAKHAVQLRISLITKVFRHFGIADDDREQVGEVMGDTAGELPDRLHALRPP